MDPDLAVIARPSIDMHLADLWHLDQTRALFAATVDDLVAGDQVLAGIAAARVVIENAGSVNDLIWVVERFRAKVEIAATVTSWICGVMDAANAELAGQLRDTLTVWAELTGTATEVLEQQFTPQTGQAALLLLGQLDRISPLTSGAADAPVRAAATARLMNVCLTAGAQHAGVAVRVARLLPRADDAFLAECRTRRSGCRCRRAVRGLEVRGRQRRDHLPDARCSVLDKYP